MARGVRKNITVPGLLIPALRLRMHEFGHRTLSPFAVDLICYDLRSGAPHAITLAISNDTQAAQDAVDAELVARYRPGEKRNGLLVQMIEHLTEVRGLARAATVPTPLNAKPERIMLPAAIWPLADLRWRELEYSSLSAYVTGLIRYDLLIGGPHLFNAHHSRPEMQAAMDRQTQRARERGQTRKLFLDYLIERAQGRALTEIARCLLRHVKMKRAGAAHTPAAIKRRPGHTFSISPRRRAD
jgi:hypothetical protein